MTFGLNNLWLGNEESLGAIINLNKFLQNPADSVATFLGREDEEENDPEFEGMGAHLIQVEGNVGLIRINGSLTNRYSFWNRYFGVISYDEIRDAAISLAEYDGVDSIVLSIDTGGGAAYGVGEISDLISTIDQKMKPVHAYTSMYSFSAGMWLASAARTHTTAQMAETGSIGVICTLCSYHDMYEKAGIQLKSIRAGKFKALGQPHEKITPEVEAEAEEKAQKIYGFFLDAMVTGKDNLSIGNKDAWAEGKTFFASDAKAIGLIDEIGTFDATIANLSRSHNNSEESTAQFSAEQQIEEDPEMAKGNGKGKRVLTPEALAAAASGAQVEAAETEAEGESAETTEEESQEEESTETTEEGSQEESTEASVNTSGVAGMADTITAQALKIGKLEAAAAEADTKMTNLEAGVTALSPIVCQSINRLQVALNQGTTDLSGMEPSVLADQFAKLNKTFEASFSVGAPTSERAAEARESAENVNDEFCTIHKPSTK